MFQFGNGCNGVQRRTTIWVVFEAFKKISFYNNIEPCTAFAKKQLKNKQS
jgi:hypothetical protein